MRGEVDTLPLTLANGRGRQGKAAEEGRGWVAVEGQELVAWSGGWGRRFPPARVAPWATRPMAGQGVVENGEPGKEWPDRWGEAVRLSGSVCWDGACREGDPGALGAPVIFNQSRSGAVSEEGLNRDWWSGARKGNPGRRVYGGEHAKWHDLPGIMEQ
jgi:hypothetical protein